MATLVGGPFDGELVEVVGVCYERYVGADNMDPPDLWGRVVYTWAARDGETIGVFKGIYDRRGDPMTERPKPEKPLEITTRVEYEAGARRRERLETARVLWGSLLQKMNPEWQSMRDWMRGLAKDAVLAADILLEELDNEHQGDKP